MAIKRKDKLGLDRQYLKFMRAYTFCKPEVDYPFQWLMIEPTNHCNLHCIMCPQAGNMTRKKGFMEYALFKKIIDEVAGSVKSVQLFHSGESFLHPRIFDMIGYSASKNIYSLINTNGTLLDETKARMVLDSGLNSLSFSFDSFHKKTYESIRKGAHFEKTLKNIEVLLELKARRKQKWPHMIIEIVEMLDTIPYIGTFIHQAKEMGFDEVRIWKFHNWANADSIANQYSPYSKNNNAYYPCEYPFFLMAIYWDGTVVPCCLDYNGTYPLGEFPDSPLENIWNSRQSKRLRASMHSRKTPKTVLCQDCSMLKEPRSSRSLAGKLFCSYARLMGTLRR